MARKPKSYKRRIKENSEKEAAYNFIDKEEEKIYRWIASIIRQVQREPIIRIHEEIISPKEIERSRRNIRQGKKAEKRIHGKKTTPVKPSKRKSEKALTHDSLVKMWADQIKKETDYTRMVVKSALDHFGLDNEVKVKLKKSRVTGRKELHHVTIYGWKKNPDLAKHLIERIKGKSHFPILIEFSVRRL
jgi:hypothetical protein